MKILNYLFFSDAESFFAHYVDCDVIFMDIEMPGMNGIKAAQKLHERNQRTMIVFVTNRTENVFRAFGLNVIGFIDKASLHQQLPAVLCQIKREIARAKTISFMLKNNSFVTVREEDILYCEMSLRRIHLVTSDQDYVLKNTTLNEVYPLFDHHRFIYIDRSSFININAICYFSDSEKKLRLTGIQRDFYISRNRVSVVRSAYLQNQSLF